MKRPDPMSFCPPLRLLLGAILVLALASPLASALAPPLAAAQEIPSSAPGVGSESSAAWQRAKELVDEWVDGNLTGLVELYKYLHAHPELSLQERETAALVADSLERAGYQVSRGVGGHGVVAVLRNGPGETLLLRGDMDALPVTEETGLAYASQVTAVLPDGRSTGVMHACGHDLHTTNLVATARLLALARSLWTGTLLVVAQPAEEIGRGAREMLAAGLFQRFPVPDYTLALHVDSALPAGTVGYTPEWAFANVDSVDVTLHGRGGHGARPHRAIDPIVTSAHFVTALQTLVSRRVDPLEAAVVTVGSLHAGTKHNVIANSAHLQLTVRSYTDEVRSQLLQGIAQLAEDTCRSFQCPEPPEIVIRKEYTPAVYNDPALTARAVRVLERIFGADHVRAMSPTMGGEDFGRYARALDVPGLIFRVGAQDPDLYRASLEPGAPPLPSIHSSGFAPAPEATLEAATRAFSLIAIDLLARD